MPLFDTTKIHAVAAMEVGEVGQDQERQDNVDYSMAKG